MNDTKLLNCCSNSQSVSALSIRDYSFSIFGNHEELLTPHTIILVIDLLCETQIVFKLNVVWLNDVNQEDDTWCICKIKKMLDCSSVEQQ